MSTSIPIIPLEPVSQQDFSNALLNPTRAQPANLISFNNSSTLQRFNIYRNNVMVSLTEALAENFPTVKALVGADFFHNMAKLYVVENPPHSRLMAEYGAYFANHIDSFPPAQTLPYLADVAKVDLARVKAYHAADATPCPAAEFAAISPDDLFDVSLSLHPSTDIIISHYAVFSLWAAHQGFLDIEQVLPETAENLLICRPELEVETRYLPEGCADFFIALSQNKTIGQAAEIAFAQKPDFDLDGAFKILIESRMTTAIHHS